MHTLQKLLLTTLTLLTLLTSTTANPAQAWVRFCDDSDCNENCGTWVSINDVGCLKQYNRKSFYVKGVRGWDSFSLIVSPEWDDKCSCQFSCMRGFHGGMHSCFKLEGYHQGSSYQWIQGDCPHWNCPMEATMKSIIWGFRKGLKEELNEQGKSLPPAWQARVPARPDLSSHNLGE